jgi:hypothetical protein
MKANQKQVKTKRKKKPKQDKEEIERNKVASPFWVKKPLK